MDFGTCTPPHGPEVFFLLPAEKRELTVPVERVNIEIWFPICKDIFLKSLFMTVLGDGVSETAGQHFRRRSVYLLFLPGDSL